MRVASDIVAAYGVDLATKRETNSRGSCRVQDIALFIELGLAGLNEDGDCSVDAT